MFEKVLVRMADMWYNTYSTKLMNGEINMLYILLVFIALKWTGAVDWPWAVVFIPLWLEIIEDIGVSLFAWWLGLDL